MKTVCVCLLLISIFQKPGICQKPSQLQEDQGTTIVRMQDRLDRFETEVQRLRDRMVQATDKVSATEALSADNARDIGILKYLGGGLVFMAGIFVAELVRRLATRVTVQQVRSS